jgi:hypothetical protein
MHTQCQSMVFSASSRNQLLAHHLYWYLRQTKRKRLSHALSLSSPVQSSPRGTCRLFGDTVVGVEAVLEILAVLVRGVVAEHLAVRRALERLEARLALDSLGGGVLHAASVQLVDVRVLFLRTAFSWLFASLGPASPLRSRFCCALRRR